MDCSTPGLTILHQLLELAQTHVHQVGDAIHHLILCRPLLLLPSIFPSIRIFTKESAQQLLAIILITIFILIIVVTIIIVYER